MSRDYDEAVAELATINDLVRWGASRLNEAGVCFGHGTDNAVDEALHLVLHAVHLEPGLASELFHGQLTARERRDAVELLRRRLEERIPASYLTHRSWFAGWEFYVDQRVLVPRSPIAELIAHGFAPWLDVAPRRILDMCTGSACIAIACAHAFPAAEVDAVDLSPEALEVARINVAAHHMEDQVFPIQSDLFSALAGRRYDLIVSNPPYVSLEEMEDLPAEYGHEPALGLTAGEHGLDVVRRLLREAPDYLSDDGLLVMEVGNSEMAVLEHYPEVPFIWPDFERGGHGVFLVPRSVLEAHYHLF